MNSIIEQEPINFTWTFLDGQVISICCGDNDLTFIPDIKTCARYIYDTIYGGTKGIMIENGGNGNIIYEIGNFRIIFDRLNNNSRAEWFGDKKSPLVIEQFQRELDRLDKLLTFS